VTGITVEYVLPTAVFLLLLNVTAITSHLKKLPDFFSSALYEFYKLCQVLLTISHRFLTECRYKARQHRNLTAIHSNLSVNGLTS